ncbi:Hypothetical protein CAP_4122 [Chondromyces apiculatus DSM 436]|uniref:Uncharacterized protein n=1 Tax=Chondromyces apiculatus DSM 436 TaxID=1192034 RepID=A0A017TI93_9BACT|nr:Hypothetical protein CAP_4122 [Chondromyces apiculatus DSM 436]
MERHDPPDHDQLLGAVVTGGQGAKGFARATAREARLELVSV